MISLENIPDWIIGEELLAKGINGSSMTTLGTAYDDPLFGKVSQPAHMQNFI